LTGNGLLIAGTAAIGSYTTFSTWMLETHRLAEDGELNLAILNVAVSLVLGFGAALLGKAIGARL
jgi:CrcB protein